VKYEAGQGGDYLTKLKIKLLTALRLPEKEAEKYAQKFLDLHENLRTAANNYFTDTEQRIRYTLTPRELHRAADDFIKYANKPSESMSRDEKFEWAFNAAARISITTLPGAIFHEGRHS